MTCKKCFDFNRPARDPCPECGDIWDMSSSVQPAGYVLKPANFAPVYLGLYPELAEVARKHGYALAVHGSMARDFDLVAVPWVAGASDAQNIIDEVTNTFAIQCVGKPETKEHGRKCWTLSVSFGDCFIDFSAMPRVV